MNTPITFEMAKLLEEKGYKLHRHSHPTIVQVIMWLYDKQGIWIWVNPYKDHAADNNEPYKAQMNVFKNGITVSKEYRTPTEAYSKAIEYILTNLI